MPTFPYRLLATGARLWWRIRRPRTLGVRVLVLDAEGRVLLVRHTYVAQWHLPGGGVKKWEATDDAAVREAREETGVAVTIERLLGVYHNRLEFKDDQVVVYVARADGAAALRGDGFEIAEVAWFALDALPDVSAATRRRLADHAAGGAAFGKW